MTAAHEPPNRRGFHAPGRQVRRPESDLGSGARGSRVENVAREVRPPSWRCACRCLELARSSRRESPLVGALAKRSACCP